MSLSDISIKRPVLAIVFSLVIILFGIVGFYGLGVREYPAVDPPVITVTTFYPGASADIIQSQITELIEQQINSIDGIKEISSTSREQVSSIKVEFNVEANLETAANDVRDRVSRAQRFLPRDVDAPVVEKADASSDPIIFMNVQSDTKDILEVNDLVDNVIKERLQTIQGVSSVRIFGEKKSAMRLWLSPSKMAALGISPLDIQTALARENVELPSGRVEGDKTELTVKTAGLLQNVIQFNQMIIREVDNVVVRLRDVGVAEIAAENERTVLKRDGIYAIGVSVAAQPGANAIAIADEFYKRYTQIKRELPPGIKLEIGYDFTTFVRKSIIEVKETLAIAFGLVVLIIFLFLRDWRSTLIPVMAIPVSIVSGFFIMYIAGFSINILTLVAIILAVGLVCDDAIVVLENIYAKIENGMPPLEASIKGANEIYFAVISTTITLVAVFLPVLFLQGLVGRLFIEFGVVLGGTILVSAFVALTLSPMMSAYLLKHHSKPNWFYRVTEPLFVNLTKSYRNSLTNFMQYRWLVFPIMLFIFYLSYILLPLVPSELAPLEDRSNIRMNALAPEGASYEYTLNAMDKLNQYVLDSLKERGAVIEVVAPSFSGAGAVNTGFVNIYLKEPNERKRTQQMIYGQVSKALTNFTEMRASVSQPPTIGSRFGGLPVQYVILASTFDSLKNILPKFLEKARQSKSMQFVDADIKFNKPEIRLQIDREKAGQLGVSVIDIARTLQLAYSGQRLGYYVREGKQYQIIAQVQRQDRDEPLDFKSIYIRNQKGKLIQLDNLIQMEEESNPTALYRFNRFVSATISAAPKQGFTLGQCLEELDQIKKQVLSDTFRTALAGQSRDFTDSSSSLLYAFIFAILLIYLVLAGQFESFIDPFIILFTVPLALTGALISLWYFKQSLNVFSQIGIIMLIGLITKNGILIVEFANQQRELGFNTAQAVIEASVQRLRPILMTSLATIFGILPIALSLGEASGSRQSLGIAVVGGLLFSSFLTLYIIPAIYSYFSTKKISA